MDRKERKVCVKEKFIQRESEESRIGREESTFEARDKTEKKTCVKDYDKGEGNCTGK